MTYTEDVLIENNASGNKYAFRAVSNWKTKKSQGVMSIPLIDTTPANTFLFRFMGQTEEFSFSFAIFNDGDDTSDGTSSIITIDDQISWLRNTIYTDEYDTYWKLTQTRHAGTDVTCVIKDLSIDANAGSPTFVVGSLSVIRGRIGAV